MKNREATDSDLKVPASVQEQNRHNIQSSIHLRDDDALCIHAHTHSEISRRAFQVVAMIYRPYLVRLWLRHTMS